MTSRTEDGEPDPADRGRDQVRQQIIRAATDLLAHGGRDAVTTRSVAVAAGVQPPVIYRLFGDKSGLLKAVAEAGFDAYLRAHHQIGQDCQDPVDDLRAGWDLAVEFGLDNPALYTLTYSGPAEADSVAFAASMDLLMRRIRRIASHGLLRIDENLAALTIHATARGAVLTALSLPEDQRDPALLTTLREAMITAVTHQRPPTHEPGPAGAARALRASLTDQTVLTAGEQHLLREWLDRLTTDAHHHVDEPETV
ncbi:TetR/AcrR family transcriptional regulator [Umezawaea endophytica]|uniref:TetR/AcrR family transcriptional regulator n=1 Tax=Umezawaea endophytica TaxID=1654476 RepID=A0A9X3AKI7_9PSEU|nr:TetR/AcrR family transcriptional regulator [Umezawaea endophytica]MCS7482955.1 TetR/AcrR family transcriptional regulator [Umezawaea endophytica]